MDFDSIIQLMEMMNAGTSEDNQQQRIMLTMLKLLDTKRQMEACGPPHAADCAVCDLRLQTLTALKPHMTGDRRRMTEILIRLIEISQLLKGVYPCESSGY